MDLTKEVLQIITKQKLIQVADTVVVGVSGGADSVALLDILCQLRHSLGIQLHIAHFNHRLRAGADRDEAFVRELAIQCHVPITVARRQGVLKSKVVSEEMARRWRFEFFAKVAGKVKASSIALAHTQNDLAETVLMRLLRGAGLSGLRGILSENHLDKERFIRPLLSIQRRQIEEHLKMRRLSYCQDETNQQDYYLRNKIRLNLLPQLAKEYNANLPQVLVDLAYSSSGDYDYLLTQAQGLWNKNVKFSKGKVVIKLKFFLKQHVSMRRMLLRISFDHLVLNLNQLSFAHIQEAEDLLWNRPSGSVVNWPQAVRVRKTEEGLVLTIQKQG
ncbi:MAG: tRNA lysidine(34) synthetase TilS [Candidatus Omnitrophica bacterium]|nr:tRNA lysidine(34) synthetase TilS [Candidatus Omnitrophota bacterium]